MHLVLVFHNMREVSSGSASEMSTHQTRVTHSGAKMVPICVISGRDKLETAGSWQQLAHWLRNQDVLKKFFATSKMNPIKESVTMASMRSICMHC